MPISTEVAIINDIPVFIIWVGTSWEKKLSAYRGCQISVNIGSGSKSPTQEQGPATGTQNYSQTISYALTTYPSLLRHNYFSRLSLFPTDFKKIH